jgi:hypothetical protein
VSESSRAGTAHDLRAGSVSSLFCVGGIACVRSKPASLDASNTGSIRTTLLPYEYCITFGLRPQISFESHPTYPRIIPWGRNKPEMPIGSMWKKWHLSHAALTVGVDRWRSAWNGTDVRNFSDLRQRLLTGVATCAGLAPTRRPQKTAIKREAFGNTRTVLALYAPRELR